MACNEKTPPLLTNEPTMLGQLPSRALSLLRVLFIAGSLAGSASAHITLISPTGGEVLTVGETHTIEWRITIQHALLNWDIEYSVSGPMGPWLPVAFDLPPGDPVSGSVHTYQWVLPNNVSNTVRVRVTMDNLGADYFAMSTSDLSIVPCASPTTYCTASMNSVGSGALIGWMGSPNVSTNSLVLTTSSAPANKPGLFFYGDSQVSVPFGDGLRCVGGSLSNLAVLVTDASGGVSQALDVTSAPANMGPGLISAGATFNFQFWYRDPTGGPSGFNLSDGLSVTFCP